MPELVALDLPPGEAFVSRMLAAWDAGDAVLPLDPRLPRPAVDRLVEVLRPARVASAGRADGEAGVTEVRLAGGIPTNEGDALVMATSGTTGDPKGVVLTHDAVRASAVATSRRIGADPDRDRWVACLPLAHIGGLAVVTRALATGTPYRILARFDAHAVAREAALGATLVSVVATTLARTDVSGYRRVLLGGAAPPGNLAANVVTTYGMTETGSGVVYDGLPLDGVELRIGDGSVGAQGEVLVRGPMLLRAYRDGTDPTVPGGWLPTGDGGSLRPDGRLAVHGRMAEVIVTGAEKVWPVAVEQVLSAHPGVSEVAVWKRPDPEWGERVVAWVVPADPSAPPDPSDLRSVVREQLAPWAAPKEVELVAGLPRTSGGKIRRTELT